MNLKFENNKRKQIRPLRVTIWAVILLSLVFICFKLFYEIYQLKTKLVSGSPSEYRSLLTNQCLKDTTFSCTSTYIGSGPVVRYLLNSGFSLIIKKYELNANHPLSSILKFEADVSPIIVDENIKIFFQQDKTFELSQSTNTEPRSISSIKIAYAGNFNKVIENDSLLCYHFQSNKFALIYNDEKYAGIVSKSKNGKTDFFDIAILKKGDFAYLFFFFKHQNINRDFPNNLLANNIL